MSRFVKWLLLSALGVSCMLLHAGPAWPVMRTVYQPDGQPLLIRHTGDERMHYDVTSDGVPVCRDKQGQWCYAEFRGGRLVPSSVVAADRKVRSIAETLQVNRSLMSVSDIIQVEQEPTGSRPLLPTQGNPIIPVILVQYADRAFTAQCDSLWYDRFFNESYSIYEGSYGSVKDYFLHQSDGQFGPDFRVVATVTLSKNMAYYGSNGIGYEENDVEMVEEAVSCCRLDSQAWSAFAMEDKIPLVVCVYAGFGEQVNSDIPEAMWASCRKDVSIKATGLPVQSILVVNELADYSGGHQEIPDGIGTFCHEFSHIMGLPDFYATNGLENNFGLDFWDIMDWGCYIDNGRHPVGYSAYERMFMGWLQPEVLSSSSSQVRLDALADSAGVHRAYIIPHPDNSDEYLLLENRTASPWFDKSFGEGMLVYHVDYSQTEWDDNVVNNIRNHQRMGIIPADNNRSIGAYFDDKMEEYQGDLYPGISGNTVLSPTSKPPLEAFAQQNFPCALSEITRMLDGTITFRYEQNYLEGISPFVRVQSERNFSAWTLDGKRQKFRNFAELKEQALPGIYIIRGVSGNNKYIKNP